MEREILFRGKRIDNGEWVYGYYIAYSVTGGGELYHHIKNPSMTVKVIPKSIGQFTGLIDCDGNKVFEDDIIQVIGLSGWCDLENSELQVVKYGFQIVDAFEIIGFSPCSFSDYKPAGGRLQSEIKVVGNIHDNPELIR